MNLLRRGRLPHDVPVWAPEGSLFFITIKCQSPGETNSLARAWGDAVLATVAFNHTRLAWFCQILLLMPARHRMAARLFRSPFARSSRGAEKLDYILKNSVRGGLVERAEDWPWVYRPADRPPPRLGG